MTKMTTLRKTVVDHTELIYTRSLQTAFRNTTFLHLIPYGIQRLASAFPYVGRRALSPGSSTGTRQPLRRSYQFKRPGRAGKAVIWGKEAMKVENSSVKMPTLSLQPCFIIACYTVPRAALHPNRGDGAQGQAVGGKCQVSHQGTAERNDAQTLNTGTAPAYLVSNIETKPAVSEGSSHFNQREAYGNILRATIFPGKTYDH